MKPLIKACDRMRIFAVAAAVSSLAILSGCVAVNVEGYTDDPTKAKYVYNEAHAAAGNDESETKQSAAATSKSAYIPYKSTKAPDLLLNPAARGETVGFNEAMNYLLAARLTLIKKAQHREALDNTTKVGVDVGLVGAILKAPTPHSNDPVLNFLTFAAVNDKINNDVRPVTLSRVYRAGVDTLDCIHDTALKIHANVDRTRKYLKLNENPQVHPKEFSDEFDQNSSGITAKIVAVENAVAVLKGDAQKINDITTQMNDAKVHVPASPIDAALADSINTGNTTAASARTALINLKKALLNDDTGRRMNGSVQRTLSVVTDFALQRTPDTTDIRASADLFAKYTPFGAAFVKADQDARKAIDAATVTGLNKSEAPIKAQNGEKLTDEQKKTAAFQRQLQTARDDAATHAATLKTNLEVLSLVLADLPNVTGEQDYTPLDRCQYTAPDEPHVSVEPDSVEVTAKGDAVTIKLTGTKPYKIQWLDGEPAGIKPEFNEAGDELELKAGESATADVKHFRLIDSTKAKSPDITLTIKAAAATPAPQPDTTTPSDTKPDKPDTTTTQGTKSTQKPQDDGPAEPPPPTKTPQPSGSDK